MIDPKRLGIFALGCVLGATSIFLLYLTFIEEPPVFRTKTNSLVRVGRSWCRVACSDPASSTSSASATPTSERGVGALEGARAGGLSGSNSIAGKMDPGLVLEAPRFFETMPPVIHTDKEGEAYVRWHEVPGAESYYVWLLDTKGETVKKVRSRRTFAFLKEIPTDDDTLEAQYKVVLSSINKLGKEGAPGTESRMLWAKNQTKVFAPKVKNIKVEE